MHAHLTPLPRHTLRDAGSLCRRLLLPVVYTLLAGAASLAAPLVARAEVPDPPTLLCPETTRAPLWFKGSGDTEIYGSVAQLHSPEGGVWLSQAHLCAQSQVVLTLGLGFCSEHPEPTLSLRASLGPTPGLLLESVSVLWRNAESGGYEKWPAEVLPVAQGRFEVQATGAPSADYWNSQTGEIEVTLVVEAIVRSFECAEGGIGGHGVSVRDVELPPPPFGGG